MVLYQNLDEILKDASFDEISIQKYVIYHFNTYSERPFVFNT